MANVMLLISSATPTASDSAIQSFVNGLGHTCTTQFAGAASYTTTSTNLIVIGSGSRAQIGTKLDALAIPVIGNMGVAPHTLFYTGSSTSPGAVSSFTVFASGDPITTPDAANASVVFASAAISSLYVPTTALGTAAVAPLRYGSNATNITRAVGAYYASGALLSDGATATPSYRLALQHLVAFDLANANGQRWFSQGITAALGSFIAPPTASAGPDQTHAVGKLVTMAFSGTAPGSTIASYTSRIVTKPAGSTAVLSSTTTTNPTITPDVAGAYVIGVITTNTASPAGTSSESTMTLTAVAPSINSGANSSQTVAPAPIPLVATVTGVGVTGSWVQGITGTPNPSTVTIASVSSASTSFQPPSVTGTYKFHFDGTDEAGTAVTGTTVTMVFSTPVLGSYAVQVYDGAGAWV